MSLAVQKLKAQILPVSRVCETELAQMYELMTQYYDEISYEQFLKDFSKKDVVILLREPRTNNIKGFSTLLNVDLKTSRRRVRGVFSGDTIIDRLYWGQRVLGKAFLKYLFLQRLKFPLSPFYWFLMSKGYKTYLLMANNFREHFPRFEKATPRDRKEIIDAFYSKAYPENYDQCRGIIQLNGPACKLRFGVTAIEEESRRKNKRIDFFAKQNPAWENGAELCCIARMTIFMPFYYQLKSFYKTSGLRSLYSWWKSKPELLEQKG